MMKALALFGILLVWLPYSQARIAITCEPNNGYMSCPAGQSIQVKEIRLGCTDEYVCESGDLLQDHPQGAMPSPYYTGLRIAEACNDRQSCSYVGRVDEKCRGKYKFLSVHYNCSGVVCVNDRGDEDGQCDNWASGDWAKEFGSECVNNPWWMARWCWKSCSGCNAECFNIQRDDWQCDYWAQYGECERNLVWMSAMCEKSCKTCSKKEVGCENLDGDVKCDGLANNGSCTTDYHHMTRNCRKACNRCYKLCHNPLGDDKLCDRWASEGQCESNRDEMFRQCTKSCGLCPKTPDECVNKDTDENCESFAGNLQCTVNPDYMLNNCKKTCLCHKGTECQNMLRDDVACANWATQGECTKNPGWMIPNCRKACNKC